MGGGRCVGAPMFALGMVTPKRPHLKAWWCCPPLTPHTLEAQQGLSCATLGWVTPSPRFLDGGGFHPPRGSLCWEAQRGLPRFVPGWVTNSSLWGIHFWGGIPHSFLEYPLFLWGRVPSWADLHLLGGPSIPPTSQCRFCPI